MTGPLLALVGRTQAGFFKKKTYLLIFTEEQTVLIPADDPVSKDDLLAKGLQKEGLVGRAAGNGPRMLGKEEGSEKTDTLLSNDRLTETVYLENNRVSQVTLTVSGSKDDNLRTRYTLEITDDSGSYEFELETAGYSGMFNLNTVLSGLFGKKFTPPGG